MRREASQSFSYGSTQDTMTVIIFFSQKEEVKKKRIDPIEKKILQVVSFNDVFLARANDASLPGIDNLFNLNRN